MRIKIQTSLGDIIVRLYDETPRHRDNFVKLAKEGYFDGTLFHRVIKDFMIQGGDPDSKGAPAGKNLGTGGPDYTIPAEFVYPQLFHKRGPKVRRIPRSAYHGSVCHSRGRRCERSAGMDHAAIGRTLHPSQLSQFVLQGKGVQSRLPREGRRAPHDHVGRI